MEKINEFLQSDEWLKFQKRVGRRTFKVSGDGFFANIIEHKLPIVGKYFYAPRGPIISSAKESFSVLFSDLISLARKNNAGWLRIEPKEMSDINRYKDTGGHKLKIVKAPHDMQPREVFVIDITKPEERLLAEMKPKTRYNIKLAEKRGVSLRVIDSQKCAKKDIEDFVQLIKITAKRDKIKTHPENYYRKMLEIIPGNILKLYLAEYDGKTIAANMIIHYGDTAIYLHGASDNELRNVMAPYILQWQAIRDAKKAGFTRYDLGGVKISNFQFPISNEIPNSKFRIQNSASSSWQGITRFKIGFSPITKPTTFPGSYDIIINRKKYLLYLAFQKARKIMKKTVRGD